MAPPTEEVIRLRDLVPDLDPTEYKLHCAVWNQHDHPLDVYTRSWDEWVLWNRWRPARNEFNRPFVFSLMQYYPEPERWLFGGIFEVIARDNAPNTWSYTIRLREDILPGCIGRLKIGYRLPGRAVRRRFENAIDQMEVVEILKLPYRGEPFPGLDQIDHSLRQLEVIYAQQRPDWRGALKQMKGVYVVNDRNTGKRYVGSAYGDTGIWARWGQYVNSLHGHNVALRELVQQEGADYAREHLFFALLEYWSMRVPDEFVLGRESYWKRVLGSREFGHNLN